MNKGTANKLKKKGREFVEGIREIGQEIAEGIGDIEPLTAEELNNIFNEFREPLSKLDEATTKIYYTSKEKKKIG